MATSQPLAPHLSEPSRLGTEISVTGKWRPATPGGRFRRSEDTDEMLSEWEDIHRAARSDPGVLSTEINHAVGEDAVLVHHVFASSDALVTYFATTATEHMAPLMAVARPDRHLVRGQVVPLEAREALRAKSVDAAAGELLFGFVKHDYRMPDPATAINVTATWTTSGGSSTLDELIYWWQQVATDAYDLEQGMVRFEAYRVLDEDALIIHEVFDGTAELKYHLTKGTAARYKKDIDQIASPERYFFRGPVSWTIRTYSRFMHLPATYSSRGSHHTQVGGTMSDGTT